MSHALRVTTWPHPVKTLRNGDQHVFYAFWLAYIQEISLFTFAFWEYVRHKDEKVLGLENTFFLHNAKVLRDPRRH